MATTRFLKLPCSRAIRPVVTVYVLSLQRVDVAPYNKDLGEVITRLGLKADTTPEALLAGLKRFALDDSVYDLLNVFPVNPYDSWVIQPGVVHAPGPWLTFEIQRPQDDANLLAWQ